VNHRVRIANHLLSLDAQDRYLRFGYAAQDTQIRLYVDAMDFERDDIFGIFDRRLTLQAVAHLAYGKDGRGGDCAEFGVSVISKCRGRGYGVRLFNRAAMHAVNEGVSTLFIHALSENAAMLKIARTAGARVVRQGSESEAFLELPRATLHSRAKALVFEHLAMADYQLKLKARTFRRVVNAW
jgi:GNAT superfamily N-acetyltransferase